MQNNKYDVIVIGGGNAGCEASLASARMGLKTLLLTQNVDSIANMPCNPAIGGIAKGQMVREIDALGGEMGFITDKAGIMFKVLNKSRGPAVWSPRAQCDKKLYSIFMQNSLISQKNLDILQVAATKLLVKNNKVTGVITKIGEEISAESVVITTGTFLNGKIFVGKNEFDGGRFSEMSSISLSTSLKDDCGLEIQRFTTCTPPRINGDSVDYSVMTEQPGDNPPMPFSHFTDIKKWQESKKQISCWLVYTNETTHKIIQNNIDDSSLYNGLADAHGPRYCPSIEDKIVRYTDKNRHQLFLEPESLSTKEVYINGLFTGLGEKVQKDLLHSIKGLENARFIRYGYAIEYDYVPPTQLKHTLETKKISNLFLAGQINGTTGYEEAASQGIIAGINAALKVLDKEQVVLNRDEAYIGILIDDLVTKGVDEPYRMFTSRAEYRLSIRSDNADLRLMDIGHRIGLISDAMYKRFELYRETLAKIYDKETDNLPEDEALFPWNMQKVQEEFEISSKYKGYINRQEINANKIAKYENKRIPKNLDFKAISSLSRETKEKLEKINPETLGQAHRIPGITPTDIVFLNIAIEKLSRSQNAK
ncbi:MAG: tRNA uridine-5-carboxymethylaminomethyl(34) synthesis enzyme MnmG [Endomicrobiaceae bacterium]|nr:tRNA uridine-5-carboxymethylaminomethyl(34) synthesis enzyme MnmG [Endomicrobiaceae bacterium]